jgi:hypothetical protein
MGDYVPLMRWSLVRVTLGDKTTRTGRALVVRGDKVTVEYASASGAFQCRDFKRSDVDALPTPKCDYVDHHGRICAIGEGHVGDHYFILRTERED